MKNIIIGQLLLIFLVVSCKEKAAFFQENQYFFDQPQPINDSELSRIPSKFHGQFFDDNNNLISVTSNLITTQYSYKFMIHEKMLDSFIQLYDLKNDRMIDKKTKEILFLKKVADSLELTSKFNDTTFRFSNYSKAKRLNGQVVLSKKDSIYWTVKIMSIENKKLIFKTLGRFSDLLKMDSITKIHSKMIDSTTFYINPSRSEFMKFLRNSDFGYDEIYKKNRK